MLILNLRPAGSMLIVWFKDKKYYSVVILG